MDFKTQVSFVGFLLAVSTLNISTAHAINQLPQPETNSNSLSIENRLSRISKAMKERNIQDLETTQPEELPYLISGFGNVRGGGGGFANRTGGGGFVNRPGGGGFLNSTGGGGFYNNRWSDGGSFFNRF